MALARAFGVLAAAGGDGGRRRPPPEPARAGPRRGLHRRGPRPAWTPPTAFGLGTPDNPVFPGMHEASALVAGATLAAARAVWRGRPSTGSTWRAACTTRCAGRPAGSACTTTRPSRSAGCWPGRGADRLRGHRRASRRRGGSRLLRRPAGADDQPARAPDDAFPRDRPGDGDRGRRRPGLAVNVALPAGTGDAGWLRAFDAVVPPLLRAFRPRCWSASTAATPTGSTRWPTWS